MTQEELDSIMSQDIGLLDNTGSLGGNSETGGLLEEDGSRSLDDGDGEMVSNAGRRWPPPPPTEEHKVVHQLDDVTKDSEVKMTEIFDQIETISSLSSEIESQSKAVSSYLKSQKELCSMLSAKFPRVVIFKKALQDTEEIIRVNKDIMGRAIDCNDAAMQAMDVMQYQDIHRQKIERVINVMRALSQYMSSLFEGRVEDNKRVGSATYITGDTHGDLASEEDIEALIASFGSK